MPVYLCVCCLFPNSSEKVNQNEIKFQGMISLEMQMDLGYKHLDSAKSLAKILVGKKESTIISPITYFRAS